MKRLAVISMVLGIVSFSVGSFVIEPEQIDVAMGQEINIRVTGNPNMSASLYLIVEWGYQSILKDPIIYPDSVTVLPYTEWEWTDSGYQIMISSPFMILPEGPLVDFTFVTMDIGDIVVSLYDDGFGYDAPIDSVTIRESPEPATLALLALGGLAVMRKRRKL